MRRAFIGLATPFFLTVASAAADAPATDLAEAVSRLATAMDRMSAAMEKQASTATGAREGERVQVAVGILGLRMGKMDRLEGEVQQARREADEIRGQVAALKAALSRAGAEEDPNHADIERSLVMLESRLPGLDERKEGLQAELDREARELSRLEAILDDWLKQQK